MANPVYEAIIVHCMDARLQKPINDWLQRRFNLSTYDRISLAGGVYELDMILKQVELAFTLHSIRTVILVNHENCGMYMEDNSPEHHAADLRQAERRIKAKFPQLKVELYYLHLTGIFERVPSA